ncbi:MaoC family dehydratase N-terminal domain-containing protein [Amycolatopsis sp. GM8]|uniref:FAS1-like dehydratase domain-containing protein n=1 Tax=Amycolatopsis sp. GM8 TaxID=2896530 RepID=UPI001F3FAE9B|nr:MaoC family dehydratase N-terminal domain-containing protein [Amycolatopsis sp. GM8]
MSFEFPLERGKIREFARATHAGHPAYRSDDAVIPPTFLAARAFWKTDDEDPVPGLGLDRGRTLHAGEEFRFHGRVPRAGETLRVSTRIGEEWHKEGRRGGALRFVTVVTEYRDADGELVAESIATAVETAKPPEGT